MTKYAVINQASGEAEAVNLTLEGAAHHMLSEDGQEYEIRADERGGFTLWVRKQVANKGWTRTVVFSVREDREQAEREIFEEVVGSDKYSTLEAITMAQYADKLREQLD